MTAQNLDSKLRAEIANRDKIKYMAESGSARKPGGLEAARQDLDIAKYLAIEMGILLDLHGILDDNPWLKSYKERLDYLEKKLGKKEARSRDLSAARSSKRKRKG